MNGVVIPFGNTASFNYKFLFMKKLYSTLAILCILMAIPATSTAQFKFGIKGGANFSEAPKDFTGIKEGHNGWYAGPMIKFTIPAIGLGLEANALYSNSGVGIDGNSYTKNSIELPLYLRYELALPGVKKVIIPFIAAGPQWGFAFGKKEFEEIATLEDAKNFTERTFRFNDSSLSLNAGLGVILFSHLQLHVNYNIALGPTSEYINKDLSGEIKNFKSKNNIWQLSLAYIF